MKELNGHTKQASNLIWNFEGWEGYYLSDIYKSWSEAKEQAWKWCQEQYSQTEYHANFRVGNANTFGFCAGWTGMYKGERILRYETKDNSYLIWLDR